MGVGEGGEETAAFKQVHPLQSVHKAEMCLTVFILKIPCVINSSINLQIPVPLTLYGTQPLSELPK